MELSAQRGLSNDGEVIRTLGPGGPAATPDPPATPPTPHVARPGPGKMGWGVAGAPEGKGGGSPPVQVCVGLHRQPYQELLSEHIVISATRAHVKRAVGRPWILPRNPPGLILEAFCTICRA